MTDNTWNRNPNVFASMQYRVNEDYANQTGADCCSCCFWNTCFAANLATAIGGIGSAVVEAKLAPKNKQQQKATTPSTPPPDPAKLSTGKKIAYWSIGIVGVGAIIGTIVYFGKKK